MLVTERLVKAWTETPTKWYPLPIAVGAFLLVIMQYRKRRAEREVQVDEHGREILRLKGPWHVSISLQHRPRLSFSSVERVWTHGLVVTYSTWRVCRHYSAPDWAHFLSDKM